MKSQFNRIRPLPFLLLLTLMLTAVCATAVTAKDAGPDPQAMADTPAAWAENVRDNKPGAGVGANFSDPSAALGEPDAVSGTSGFYALGNALNSPPQPPILPSQCEAYLIVDFGDKNFVDGAGNDITVFEVAAGGVAEATWIYIGREEEDSELWLYAGQTGGSVDGVDIGGVAEPGEQFNMVALCDFPDGISSGSPFGGPDIDAIGALHVARTGLTVNPEGPGWKKDNEPLPVGEDTPIDPPAVIVFDCVDCPNTNIDVNLECANYQGESLEILMKMAIASGTVDSAGYRKLFSELIESAKKACTREDTPNAAAQDPMAIFELLEGGFSYTVENDIFEFTIETEVADLDSAGLNHFSAVYDPQSNETTAAVTKGSLAITPLAPGEDPFTLNAGQQVLISSSGPGPVIDLSFQYMPMVTGAN